MGKIRTTYTTYTPESIEQGDSADNGWIDEDGETVAGVHEAVRFLRNAGVTEASGSHFHKGVWYSTEPSYTDYGTGEQEERSYHLSGFTMNQERRVFEAMKARR